MLIVNLFPFISGPVTSVEYQTRCLAACIVRYMQEDFLPDTRSQIAPPCVSSHRIFIAGIDCTHEQS